MTVLLFSDVPECHGVSLIREEETSECTNLCTLEVVKLRIRMQQLSSSLGCHFKTRSSTTIPTACFDSWMVALDVPCEQ